MTMLTVVVVAVALAIVIGALAGLVISRSRRQRALLEPPPRAPMPAPPEVVEEVEAPPEVVEEVEAPPEVVEEVEAPPEAVEEVEAPPVKPTFRERLSKARGLLSGYVSSVLSRSSIDEATWEELEEALIRADVGIGTTQDLLEAVRREVETEGLSEPSQVLDCLKSHLKQELADPIELHYADAESPSVWLFVGVNGVGKTTTIGKLGRRAQLDGKSVVMAAGDTFRAAAAEQLQMWAKRVGAELVRGNEGGDPSAVIFDAVARADARGFDLVLADTAGRLHTKTNLMEELRKVRRVADKGAGEVAEVLLVIDATTGQNGLVQAQQFADAVEVTGVVLTKLDGSAKGGIVLAIRKELGIPVKLVGLGEGPDDLVDFDAGQFVDALFE